MGVDVTREKWGGEISENTWKFYKKEWELNKK